MELLLLLVVLMCSRATGELLSVDVAADCCYCRADFGAVFGCCKVVFHAILGADFGVVFGAPKFTAAHTTTVGHS